MLQRNIECGKCKLSSKYENDSETLNFRLPLTVKPLSYDIEIKPNIETMAFEGKVKLEFEALANFRKLLLHSKDLEIKSAHCNVTTNSSIDADNNKSATRLTCKYNQKHEFISLEGLRYKKGQCYTLHIMYSGIICVDFIVL